MKKFLYIFYICLLSFKADAEVFVIADELNFGKFVQVNGDTSTIIIDANGLRTMFGAVNASNIPPKEGRLTFVSDNTTYTSKENKFVLNPKNQESLPHCMASIKNLTFSNQENVIGQETTSSVSTGIGATLELGGYCKEGLYTGSLMLDYEHIISLNNTEETSSNNVVMLNFAFEVEEPLSANVKQDMFFGTYILPSTDATIVLNPNGANIQNISVVGTKQPHGATVEIEGVSNRSVSISFSADEVYLTHSKDEDATPLKADNFTLYPAGIIRLPDLGETVSAKKDVFVGATLHVPQSTAPGEYKGNVTLTFLYNYE